MARAKNCTAARFRNQTGSQTLTLHSAATHQRQNMNKKELIAALADKTRSTKADADRSVSALIELISSTLKKGGKITLAGFGIFEVRERAARIGRNPRTGEPLKIKAAKVPAFKAGATLKAALNGGKK
jgi:DNA-binding protein HU-beta